MTEEIEEKLQEEFPNMEIEVEYVKIKTYKIKISVKNKNIIKRSVSFEYKWGDIFTFSSNIEQIKYSINKYFKLYLESEVNNENN